EVYFPGSTNAPPTWGACPATGPGIPSYGRALGVHPTMRGRCAESKPLLHHPTDGMIQQFCHGDYTMASDISWHVLQNRSDSPVRSEERRGGKQTWLLGE